MQRARAGLLAGGRPEAVFTALAKDIGDYRAVALAMCAVAGIPRAQAQQRWADTGEQVAALIEPGEEADLGAILELAGVFDVHRRLDENELQIRHLLDLAYAAAGGLPSGYGQGVIRLLQTGHLTDAFVSMTTYGARRGRPMPPAYWSHLLAAADLVTDTDDDRFESCVTLCRRMLDQADTPTSR